MTPATVHPVPDRSRVLRLSRHPVAAGAALAGLILLWELAARLRLVPPLFLPAPSLIALRAWELSASGLLPLHVAASLKRILAGYALGAALGILVGVGTGFFGYARAIGQPLIGALYPIPKIAILPLLILWGLVRLLPPWAGGEE